MFVSCYGLFKFFGESDDNRCCTNTIVLLKMSIIVLETCTEV